MFWEGVCGVDTNEGIGFGEIGSAVRKVGVFAWSMGSGVMVVIGGGVFCRRAERQFF